MPPTLEKEEVAWRAPRSGRRDVPRRGSAEFHVKHAPLEGVTAPLTPLSGQDKSSQVSGEQDRHESAVRRHRCGGRPCGL